MTLTRKEILNEPPGIQLDKWVSVHVMGYEIRKEYIWDQSFHEFYYREGIKYENVHYPDEWQPSKYIDAAWEVVDKLRIAVTPQSIGAPEELSYMAEYENAPYVELKRVFARTAPEAICKCALLAVLNL
ncbi:hypothetical protein NST28_29160 [Paenibacillus sp. FSL R10-2791]|uniref:BC1872 family protein n=1 Tax=Paenibacillus sp. FSL R10-2791 TaxID=2954695 RepID=UPI0030FA6588